MEKYHSEELSGVEGLLYIIPVFGIFFGFIFICYSNTFAMSWLTQCMHEVVSIIVAIAFIGWLLVSFTKDAIERFFSTAIAVVYC